jgi:CspA family cold shock protein
MSETFSKKENIKKKAKKKEQKLQLREDRKSNNNKGKSLDDMMVYIDENGNFTSVPPDPKNKTEISVENIQLGAAPIIKEDSLKKGKITFFTDERSQERYFVHRNDMIDQADLNDKVTFEVERRERGLVAIDVKLLK